MSRSSLSSNELDEDFLDKYGPDGEELTFTCYSGKVIELVPDGKQLRVTWETREDYIEKVLDYKLSESKQQIAAVRDGIANIIPSNLLTFFTWNELELTVRTFGNENSHPGVRYG